MYVNSIMLSFTWNFMTSYSCNVTPNLKMYPTSGDPPLKLSILL